MPNIEEMDREVEEALMTPQAEIDFSTTPENDASYDALMARAYEPCVSLIWDDACGEHEGAEIHHDRLRWNFHSFQGGQR